MNLNRNITLLPLFLLILFLTSFPKDVQSREITETAGVFYFDAVIFKSDTIGIARFDVFTLVPYASMTFVRSGDIFGAEYQIIIKIIDKIGNPVKTRTVERRIKEKNYFATQGGNADFDYSQSIFYLLPGEYSVEVVYFDKTGNRSFKRSRTQIVLDFDKYNFSTSGIILVSSIEENKGNYIITPHISDNIGLLSEYFFIFFESYRIESFDTKVDFVYQFINSKNEVILTSERITKEVPELRNQHYLRIPISTTLPQGNYTLRLLTLKSDGNKEFDEGSIIASSERSIKYMKDIGGTFVADIDNAIRQLRYIAAQSEMDYMQAPENIHERQLRFEDFWREHDPTPNTERNEAYDEYFYRVDYANRNFKSYTAGWRTDMGKVYIIYGPPTNIEKKRLDDGRYYERWSYSTKTIIFVDYNGFGDFRLYSPKSIMDKYKFE